MKRFILPLSALLLTACETAPKIIPDTTADSPVVLKLRHEILNGDKITSNWGWMLWYLPVLLLALAWGWKEFFKKKEECEEEKAEEKPEATSTPPQTP
jgi:hypothetical protein